MTKSDSKTKKNERIFTVKFINWKKIPSLKPVTTIDPVHSARASPHPGFPDHRLRTPFSFRLLPTLLFSCNLLHVSSRSYSITIVRLIYSDLFRLKSNFITFQSDSPCCFFLLVSPHSSFHNELSIFYPLYMIIKLHTIIYHIASLILHIIHNDQG